MASLTCTLKPASIPPGTLHFWIAGVLVIKLFKCVISSMEHIYASNELYIKATAILIAGRASDQATRVCLL